MRREWRVRRTTIERTDGQRRWDCAYQCLLKWSGQTASRLGEHSPQLTQQEATDESRDLCSRLDIAPTENADH
jgi:hypothetical protein